MSQPASIQILWIGKVHDQPHRHSGESPLGYYKVIYSRSGLAHIIHRAVYLSMWTTDETSTSQLCLYRGSQTPDPEDIIFQRRNGVLYAIYSMGHTIPTLPPPPARLGDNSSVATIFTAMEALPHSTGRTEPMLDAAPDLFTPGLHTSVAFDHPSSTLQNLVEISSNERAFAINQKSS